MLVLITPSAQAKPKPLVHTVVIDGMQFSPANLEVSVGDTVVWINKDPFPHTVTSDRNGFDSKPSLPEHSWSYVTPQRGTFPYSCALHENMKGTLLVK
ncbi:MAG: cupredoxin family copper-binding protein [Pseudomonadota bacterium]|nr:cupredoxin family copper-binding protein [Pseudomonadota bacterium]